MSGDLYATPTGYRVKQTATQREINWPRLFLQTCVANGIFWTAYTSFEIIVEYYTYNVPTSWAQQVSHSVDHVVLFFCPMLLINLLIIRPTTKRKTLLFGPATICGAGLYIPTYIIQRLTWSGPL